LAAAHTTSVWRPIAGPVGEKIGRTVFGIGAIITWLIVAAMAHARAKKIFGKKN